MDKILGKAAEYAGDALEQTIKKACGVKERDDKKKGGVLSFLGGGKDGKDNKNDNKKGGLFSSGDDKKKDEDKGGVFSKFLNKDDDRPTENKGGFKGLFNEQEGASGGSEKEEMPKFDEGSTPAGGLHDEGFYSDLMDVADEMSKGK